MSHKTLIEFLVGALIGAATSSVLFLIIWVVYVCIM